MTLSNHRTTSNLKIGKNKVRFIKRSGKKRIQVIQAVTKLYPPDFLVTLPTFEEGHVYHHHQKWSQKLAELPGFVNIYPGTKVSQTVHLKKMQGSFKQKGRRPNQFQQRTVKICGSSKIDLCGSQDPSRLVIGCSWL